MKANLLIAFLLLTFVSCKNAASEKKEETTAVATDIISEEVYEGEFFYTPEAAVLKSDDMVYGVANNDLAKELAERVKGIEKDEYDMVPVTVKGEVKNKPEGTEGWDQIITITEIINVSNTPQRADVEIKANTN